MLPPLLEAKLRELPGSQDVTSDLQIKNPQVNVEIDRDKASALGVTAQQIEDALYTAYASRQISTIYAPNNEYQVIMELEPQYQTDPSALSLLYIRSSSGQLVPLDAVASLTAESGPLTVNHLGQIPSVTLSFNLKPGVSLGDAVAVWTGFRGPRCRPRSPPAFRERHRPFRPRCKGSGFCWLMAILVIYIVLGILYESFIHPADHPFGSPFSRLRRSPYAADLSAWI